MARGHRSRIKKERNAEKDPRPNAHHKFAIISSSKAKIVLDQIKGKDVETARAILLYSPRYGAKLIYKVLNSAVANAENNQGKDVSKLYVDEAFANQGPILKRMQPRARGSAYRINKYMSHISIILNERQGG